MIGILPTTTDQNGVEKINLPVSEYHPPKAVEDLTLKIRQDYQIGYDILHRPFKEFNDMSLLQRMDADQKAFNIYVPPKTEDPTKKWQWNGVRPTTRNKVLSVCAHLVSGMSYPGIFAQSDEDEEDKKMAYVMRELVEWNIKHSDYEMTFLYGVLAALVNPVAYVHVDYAEVFQTIKVRQNNGEITTEEVLDKVLSGFQIHNVPADEILIANPYEFHLQRQRFLIRKRLVDYDELKAKYGKHANWKYISPGIKALYNSNDGMFYEQFDEDLMTLGEEVIYHNRQEDLEVPYVNGIYLGDTNVKANPIRHRDNKNRPKYCYVKLGAEPIDEKRFWAYKSLAAKLANEQESGDQMWRMQMDGTLMEVMGGLAGFGTGKLDSRIIFPGAVTNFTKEARVEQINKGRNLAAGWNAIANIERDEAQSSQSEQRGGQVEDRNMTAYQVAKIEQNARVNLGIIGRMIIQMVAHIGELVVDDIVTYQSIGHLEETSGGTTKMTYRNFLLSNKTKDGKKLTEKIVFDGGLINRNMSEKERKRESFKIKKQQGKDAKLTKVNPVLFSRLNFLIEIEPEAWMPKNERFEKLLKLENYDRLIASPVIRSDPDALIAVTRDFLLEPIAKGESEKYLPKDKQNIINQLMASKPQGASQAGPIKRVGVETLLRE